MAETVTCDRPPPTKPEFSASDVAANKGSNISSLDDDDDLEVGEVLVDEVDVICLASSKLGGDEVEEWAEEEEETPESEDVSL